MADLPCLQSVKLGSEVFKYVHSVVMEWMGWWVRFTDITIHWTREMGSFRRWREGSKDDGWRTLQLQECLENEEWDWAKGWTDISWLVSFRGEGSNFYAIDSVILESMDLLVVWRRHPSTVIRGNPLWLLQLRDGLFPSVLEHRRVFRCCCARIGHPRVWWVPLNWLYVCSDQVMDCSMICCSFRIIQLGAVIMHIL